MADGGFEDLAEPLVIDLTPGLAWPLDAAAMEKLRWYLEDYLRMPYGVYESRGPEVQRKLAPWGEAIFAEVFKAGPARDAYQRMRDAPKDLQMVFRSSSPELLALPWELMKDPASEVPLALDGVEMDRSLPPAGLGASFPVPAGRLRVLMVISRPAGTADIGYRMIARPLLERLAAVRGRVDLVVLRPATLDALEAVLAEAGAAGEPFQVVHFDGHGGIGHVPGQEATLVFQTAKGGRDPVPASKLAQVLAAARVPVVVLNACQSGAIGKNLEAAVATRLLQSGAGSVVSMAYSVYAVAAAEFMAAFYEQLFAGDTVSESVTAGRQRLFRHDGRPSPKGDLPLADWVVPVHYRRDEIRFSDLATARSEGGPSLDQALDQLRDPPATGSGPLAPVGVFIGRDSLFYELEVSARLRRVVLLYGAAGTGKTELASAFARWWRDTGGIEQPDWVFWHSFEPGLASGGLRDIITEIGLVVSGPNFARLDLDDRTAVVEEFLSSRRALLIWDNFESVRSLADASRTASMLSDGDCQQLAGFLRRVTMGGLSTVLVTSRSRETWLDDGSLPGTPADAGGSTVTLRRIPVQGLGSQEAAEYAGHLLAPYPAAAPRRADRDFGEMMDWLDGHPLSMRLVLPHLNTTDAATLLSGLRGIAPLPGGDGAVPDEGSALAASLSYSLAHLDLAAQRLLTAVCLFQNIVGSDVLTVLSGEDDVPARFRGITGDAWADVLDTAAGAGLLSAKVGDMYRIHPALPAWLAASWRAEDPGAYEAERDAAIRALLSAYAGIGRWLTGLLQSDEGWYAFAFIERHNRTMASLLGVALGESRWQDAREIAAPLDSYWTNRGLLSEADAWTDRALRAVQDASGGTVPSLDGAAGSLWLAFSIWRTNKQFVSGQLVEAEGTWRNILAALDDQVPSPIRQGYLATAYYQLGMIAQRRQQRAEAADWYGKALAIGEELGHRQVVAQACHQLGMVAQDRNQPDEAVGWYRRSLDITEELGDQPGMATSYHQLGIVAQRRNRPDEAADWYHRSLAIDEELGNKAGLATSYHQLGQVARDRARLADAQYWYTRSLAITEELGDQASIASNYHQLGQVAHDHGQLTDAADWYYRSLAISEELGASDLMGMTYSQLGRLAAQQPDNEETNE